MNERDKEAANSVLEAAEELGTHFLNVAHEKGITVDNDFECVVVALLAHMAMTLSGIFFNTAKPNA